MMTSAKGTVTTRWKRLCFDLSGNGSLSYRNGSALKQQPSIAVAHREHRPDDDGGSSGSPLDSVRFLLEWLRDPVRTAAVAPSGRALVSLITRDIDGQVGAVLELGPGTGVFTRGLVARGVAECDLTLVEQNPIFARLLKQRFPRATVLSIDAAELNLSGEAGARVFGAAVCGLGLRSMDAGQVEAIMRAAFTRMRPGAALYLFTYGARCPVPDEVLDRLALVADRIGTTLRNVPPASVYRILRRAGDC